jgi:hypothetical protein
MVMVVLTVQVQYNGYEFLPVEMKILIFCN